MPDQVLTTAIDTLCGGGSLSEDQAAEVLALIDRLEQDDDVQKVFHTLA